MSVPVIAPDNDAVIAAMLDLPRSGRARWWLETWQVRERWIDARYRTRGGPWAILRLVAPSQPVPAKHQTRASERFVIVVLQRSAGAELSSLLDALEASVRAREQDFCWHHPRASPAPTPQDIPRGNEVERLAVRAGLKPAARMRLHQWEAPYEAGLWLRAGFAVAVVETDAGADGARSYLMVAREPERVAALADAELRQYLPMPAQLEALRACGELLGYPPCCVEAFLRATALEDGRDAERTARRGNFHRADAAWVAHADARLNTLLDHEGLALISFDPCRFDCPAALAIAAEVASAVEAEHPGYTALLREVVAIDHDDQRAILELGADAAGGARILSARPSVPSAADFAARLVGCRVDDDGRVPELDTPCRVFWFE